MAKPVKHSKVKFSSWIVIRLTAERRRDLETIAEARIWSLAETARQLLEPVLQLEVLKINAHKTP